MFPCPVCDKILTEEPSKGTYSHKNCNIYYCDYVLINDNFHYVNKFAWKINEHKIHFYLTLEQIKKYISLRSFL